MPDYWQAELVPGVWLQGPGIPELVSDHYWGWGKGAGSIHSQVWVPECPRGCTGLLVGRAWAWSQGRVRRALWVMVFLHLMSAT